MSNPTPRAEQVALAVCGRADAHRLLDRLLTDRTHSETRLAAAGKNDPLKKVTGTSSLDRAITSTQEIVDRMDDLVHELQGLTEGLTLSRGRNGTSATNGTSNGNGHAPSLLIETFELPGSPASSPPRPRAVASANATP